MVPEVGLEPTRGISPADFESATSANSIIPAIRVIYCSIDAKRNASLSYLKHHPGHVNRVKPENLKLPPDSSP